VIPYSHMNKLLIFDFDGTIVTGSNDKYMACFAEAIKSTGVKQDFDIQYRKLLESWGKGQKEMLENAMSDNLDKVDPALEYFENCTLASNFFTGVTLVNGAKEALEELKGAGCTLAIASGSRRSAINQLLSEFKIAHFFSKIISSEDDIQDPAQRKPNPYMLEVIRTELGFNKPDTYYIGDATSDIETAKNAGVNSIAVLTGHMNKNDARAISPDIVLSSIAEITNVLLS